MTLPELARCGILVTQLLNGRWTVNRAPWGKRYDSESEALRVANERFQQEMGFARAMVAHAS